MSKKILVLIIALVIPLIALAQDDTAWVRYYDGPEHSTDEPSSLMIDDSGNVFVAGYSYGEGTGTDFALIKYNAVGTQVWVARYNTEENYNDYPNAMTRDKDGNFYLVGGTGKTFSNAPNDFLTVKFDRDGAVQWANRYGGTAHIDDEAWSVATDDAGNVYVGGTVKNLKADKDFCVIKYNPDGKQEWVKVYNGPASRDDDMYNMIADRDGNVYACGTSVNKQKRNDFFTVKYSSAGKELWTQRHADAKGEIGIAMAEALALDKDGNVYVAGTCSLKILTVKYSPNGKKIWEKRLWVDSSRCEATMITLDDSANVYVGGIVINKNMNRDWAVVKLDSKGNELWHYVYNGEDNGEDVPKAMTLSQYGNLFIAGVVDYDITKPDFNTIILTTSTGKAEVVIRHTGLGDNQACAIAVDKDANIYVTGDNGELLHEDFLTIKYIPK